MKYENSFAIRFPGDVKLRIGSAALGKAGAGNMRRCSPYRDSRCNSGPNPFTVAAIRLGSNPTLPLRLTTRRHHLTTTLSKGWQMLPDPIERMEMRIDDLIFDQCLGVPDGCIRCFDCKQVVSIDEIESVDARPDSPAICFQCLNKRYNPPRPSPE